MSLSFKVKKEHLSNGSTVAIACLSGFVDIRTVKIFEQESLKLLDENNRFLILNFTNVGYMNSTGLGILVKVQDRYKDMDGDLILVDVPSKILDLFKMLGMDTILKIKKTDQEALDSLPFPLLPQIPDIPDMSFSEDDSDDSGDDFSAPPLGIPGDDVFSKNVFLAPDSQVSDPIVISGEEADEANLEAGLSFPPPPPPISNFDISEEEGERDQKVIGEATSIDVPKNENELQANNDYGDIQDTENVSTGIEITKGFKNFSHEDADALDEDDELEIDEDEEEDDEDEMAISELDLTAEDDFIEDEEDEKIPVIPAPDNDAEEKLEEEALGSTDHSDDISLEDNNGTSDESGINLQRDDNDLLGNDISEEEISTENEELSFEDNPFSVASGDTSLLDSNLLKEDDSTNISGEQANFKALSAESSIEEDLLTNENAIADTLSETVPGEISGPDDIDVDQEKMATPEIPDLEIENNEELAVAEEASEDTEEEAAEVADETMDQDEIEATNVLEEAEKRAEPEEVFGGSQQLRKKTSKGATLKEETKEAKAPRIKRKTAVRFYEKMNPFCSFPLMVAFSKDKLKAIPPTLNNIKQMNGKSINVEYKKPKVTVVPTLKGCSVYPSSMEIDVTPEMVSAEFWVTPIIEGSIEGNIEIRYEGNVVQKIDIQSESVKQTWAKISALGAVVVPLVSFVLEGLNLSIPKTAWNLIPQILNKIESSIGISNFGVLIGGLLVAAGVTLYQMNKPKEAEEMEKFFSTESE